MGEEPRSLEQEDPGLNLVGGVLVFGSVPWTFLGFWVYWLRTGEGTIRPGTVSDAGTLVWFGPLFLAMAVLVAGCRGPLWRLYSPPFQLSLNDAALSWVRPGSVAARAKWSDIGGVNMEGSRYAWYTVIRDLQYREIVRFDGADFRDPQTGSRGRLSAAVVAVRPDRYELVNEGRSDEAAILRLTGERDVAS